MAIRNRYTTWRDQPNQATPSDATSVGIPTMSWTYPQLQQGQPERVRPATLGVKPDLFSMENPSYVDQTAEQQKRAMEIYDRLGEDAVLAAGLQPPRLSHGRIAGIIRSLAGGISGFPHETRGSSNVGNIVGSLVGEGIKYAALMQTGGAAGLPTAALPAAAATASAAGRQGVAELTGGKADAMGFALEAGGGALIPEVLRAFMPKGAAGASTAKAVQAAPDAGSTPAPSNKLYRAGNSPYATPDKRAAENYAARNGGAVVEVSDYNPSVELSLSDAGVTITPKQFVTAMYKRGLIDEIPPGGAIERSLGFNSINEPVLTYKMLERPKVLDYLRGRGIDGVRFTDRAEYTGAKTAESFEHEAVLDLRRTAPSTTPDYAAFGKQHNARFDGLQEAPKGKPPYLTYTDNETGTTVLVRNAEELPAKLAEKRAAFNAVQKPAIDEAGGMMLNSGVDPNAIKQIQAWWSGKVDDVADGVKQLAFKVAPTISEKVRNFLVGGAPSEVKDILQQRRYGINIKRGQAIEFGKAIQDNIPSEYHEEVYKILDPGALGEMGSIPTKYHPTVMQARDAIDRLSQQYIDLGIGDTETFANNLGQYMGRYYKNKKVGGPWRWIRGVHAKGERLMKRTLTTPEERQAAGLIKDPTYAVTRTLGDMTFDLETYKAFRSIAQNPEWTGAEWREGLHNVAIPAESRLYGELAGKYVTRDIYDEIMSIVPMRGEMWKTYDRLLGAWKFGKTALSPATHGRNIFSNFILADLGGLRFYDPTHARHFARAAKGMLKKDELYREAQETGLLGSDWYGEEIRGMLENVAAGTKNNKTITDRVFDWVTESKPGRAIGKAGDLYQGEEHFFKLAMYAQGRADGLTPELAAARAQKYLFDYGKLSPGLRGLRRSPFGHPFLTFTAKSLPVVIEATAKHPFRVGKYVAAIKMLNEYSRVQLGMSDEDYEKAMALRPEWQQNGFNVLLPVRGKEGHPLIWDFTYNLPWGNIADQGRIVTKAIGNKVPVVGPVVDNFILGNPITNTAFGVVTNKDMFRDKPVVPEADRLMGKTLSKNAEFVARQFAPSGVYSVSEVVKAITQEPMRSGEARGLLQTVADRLAGIRVRPIDEETSRSIQQWGKIGDIKELKKLIRSVRMDKSKSTAEQDREIAEIKEVIRKIAGEARRIGQLGNSEVATDSVEAGAGNRYMNW